MFRHASHGVTRAITGLGGAHSIVRTRPMPTLWWVKAPSNGRPTTPVCLISSGE